MNNPWRRSTRCSTGACLEVRRGGKDDGVQVRDSKDANGSVLTFGQDAWRAFIDAVKGAGL